MTDHDRDTLEQAAREIAAGHPRATTGDGPRDAEWLPILIEAARVLLPILVELCSAETPTSMARRARAIRERRWWNLMLHREYRQVCAAADKALVETAFLAGQPRPEPEDAEALADRVLLSAATAPVARISEVVIAARGT